MLTDPQPGAIPEPANDEEQIWVLDSGWHTGLVLSRAELGQSFIHLLQPAPNAQYFMFGWGNRRFYMAPNPTLGMDFAALFPSRNVVLLETCVNPPHACYTSAVKFRIVSVSHDGLNHLDRYLADSFQTDARGQLEPILPGPDADSEFFASGLSYDAFHTCNTWTAEALHAAGLPVAYHGVIFADQLWQQLNHDFLNKDSSNNRT
ncbi:MAG: DUF2459 domain-containing protein [Gammaproteobacteria bacterium]